MKNPILIAALIVAGALALLFLVILPEQQQQKEQTLQAPQPPPSMEAPEEAQPPEPEPTPEPQPTPAPEPEPESKPEPEPTTTPGLSPEQRDLALAVIERMGCGSCHTLQAAGLDLRGQVGPDLTKQGARGRTDEWLRRQLLDPTSIPDGEVVPGFEGMQVVMPSYDRVLSDEEVEALIAFLQSLK